MRNQISFPLHIDFPSKISITLLQTKKQKPYDMIYLAYTSTKRHSIHTRMSKEISPESYLILVIASTDDQYILWETIKNHDLTQVDWLLSTIEEWTELAKGYKEHLTGLIIAELLLEGGYTSTLNIPSLLTTSLAITDFGDVVNRLLRKITNSAKKRGKTYDPNITRLQVDFMSSGRLRMATVQKRKKNPISTALRI